MAMCVVCGKSTELYDSGVPICLDCEHENGQTRKPSRPPQNGNDQVADDELQPGKFGASLLTPVF